MPNPNELNTNSERIRYAQTQLTLIPDLIRAYEAGQVDIAGESIELSTDVKSRLKQKVIAAKTNCVAALGAIHLT